MYQTADSLTRGQFDRAAFLMAVLVFVSRYFELGRTWLAGEVDHQSRTVLFFNSAFYDCFFAKYCTVPLSRG